MAHGQPEYLMLRVALNKCHLLGWNTSLELCFIFALGLLAGCAAPLAAISSSGTAVASTAGTAAVANPALQRA